VVEGAKPDARNAAVPDPQRDAAAAVAASLSANAPIHVTGSAWDLVVQQHQPVTIDLTLTNRSTETVRFGYHNWVRLEVEYPDGRTEQFFDRRNNADWNQMLQSTVLPQGTQEFKATVHDRFTFPELGKYTLHFWFPRATGPYTRAVTVIADEAPR
jgi:hypothetical protein